METQKEDVNVKVSFKNNGWGGKRHMICTCCANRNECFGCDITDEELVEKDVLCNYDRYELAEDIDIDDVIEESYRRYEESQLPRVETA